MHTIVTLIDFSDLTPFVLAQSELFSKALNSKLILVHVVPKDHVVVDFGIISPVIPQAPRPESIAMHYDSLKALADGLTKKGVDVLVEQLVDADISKVLEACGNWTADLVIVGSHHHGALYNWFMGSFTSDVLKHAHCPVLVVPATPAQ